MKTDLILKKFEELAERFEQLEERLDRSFSYLSQEIALIKDTMVTKQEFNEFKDFSYRNFDYLVGTAERHEQERLATNYALERTETRVGILEKDSQKIRRFLKLS